MPQTPARRHPTPALLAAMLSPTLLFATGCASSWVGSGPGDSPEVALEDFVSDHNENQPTANTQDPHTQTQTTLTSASTDPQDQDATDTDAQDPQAANSEALPINGMVGHVNGEAIYADQIFDVNLAAQLENYGERYDGQAFRRQAAFEIAQRLRDVVIDKLILGEAERNLQDTQRQMINARVQDEREELLRFYGQGSLARAEAEYYAEHGITMDEHLVSRRDALSLTVYLQSRIAPLISVNQNQVARWYNEHIDQFQRPARRIFRIIRVDSQANPIAAEAVERRLRRGEDFAAVASDPLVNIYNAPNGGIYYNGEFYPGNYGIEPVNEALMQLDEGEFAGPIPVGDHTFFVYLVELEPAVSLSLRDAQIQIEQMLREQQFLSHVGRFRAELLDRGGYTDLEEMGEKLLDIAAARYDH